LPKIIGIGVAKGTALSSLSITDLANETLNLLNETSRATTDDVSIDSNYMGSDYAVATQAATDAAKWAAHRGAWVLDAVYSAKGFSGLLGLDAKDAFGSNANVVFIHTGGLPSIFASH
jgi:D-cysteine desulfhydrase